ncbi:MAG: hypothetical protein KatS3mg087_0603 [Patescibacteria group bacterium]|nr:MAG: hypothetical protein KatS3mg087_0603 [Patescibacteria group bacterium]
MSEQVKKIKLSDLKPDPRNANRGTERGRDTAAYPVALPEFFIKAFSDDRDRVYDPFLGSGTTMVAAHKNNRIGLGTEISEKYCDLILSRMEEITGESAILIGGMNE